MSPHRIRWVRSEDELASFRAQHFTVEALYARLEHSNVLINEDAGVGKSTLLAELVEQHLAGEGRYDLVIYLASRLDVLREQPFVQEALAGKKSHRMVTVLEARPRAACGALDGSWVKYETTGCALVGRVDLCGRCPKRENCSWPTQLWERELRGKRVIAGAQAYLYAMPDFVPQMLRKTGATSALVILDEAAFLDTKLTAHIAAPDLERSLQVLEQVAGGDASSNLRGWIELHRRLLDPVRDLRNLRAPRPLDELAIEELQAVGIARFGRRFRFMLFELARLPFSRRWRAPAGGIDYVRRPRLRGARYVVAAAGVPLELARHRLADDTLEEFNPGVRFLHEGTRVFNIRSSTGAARFYWRNAPQVLFAVAGLIVKLAAAGKRAIVIAKKRFAPGAAEMLEQHLRELSGAPYRVVYNATVGDVTQPLVVPMIHYGLTGVNLFEHFEAAIACTSFLARADVLEEQLNDGQHPDEEVHVGFAFENGRRRASVKDYWTRQRGYEPLVAAYQHHLEAAWAEQALGRVRFAVRPRVVVFFQSAAPRFPVEKEFRSLAAFRQYFGLAGRRSVTAAETAARVLAAVRPGRSADEIAEAAGVSRSTVFRQLSRAGVSLTRPNEEDSRARETPQQGSAGRNRR